MRKRARVIANEWVIATKNASSAQKSGSNANLKNATDGLGEAHVSSWLPASRVLCRYGKYKNIKDSFQTKVEVKLNCSLSVPW